MHSFQTIEFLGYVETPETPHIKFAHVRQRVFYSEQTSASVARVMDYSNEPRELMFTLNANNENFKNLLSVSPNARIIRTIANEPILTTQEEILVGHGFEQLSLYAEKQLLTDASGRLVIDEFGLPIYMKQRLFLNAKDMVDQDLRICPCPADLVEGEVLEGTDETGFFDFED